MDDDGIRRCWCGKVLVQKPGERLDKFFKRRHCDVVCRNRQTADRRKNAKKGSGKKDRKKVAAAKFTPPVMDMEACDSKVVDAGLLMSRMLRGSVFQPTEVWFG